MVTAGGGNNMKGIIPSTGVRVFPDIGHGSTAVLSWCVYLHVSWIAGYLHFYAVESTLYLCLPLFTHPDV